MRFGITAPLLLLALACNQAGRPSGKSVVAEPLVLRANEELPPGAVQAIVELADGAMAFGTSEGLVIWRGGSSTAYTGPAFDPLTGRERPGNSELPHNDVAALVIGSDGTLWIGTGRGLARLRDDKIENKIENVTSRLPVTGTRAEQQLIPRGEGGGGHVVGPTQGHDVTSLHCRKDGRILIGTRNAGLILYDPAADSFKLLHRQPDMNKWVTGIDEDPAGTVYAAIINFGIVRLSGEQVEVVSPQEFGISTEHTRCLVAAPNGAIWIGTHDGIGIREPDGTFRTFRELDGVPGAFVWTVFFDSSGRAWASTEDGWAAWDGRSWRYAEVQDGPPPPKIAVSRTAKGHLWLGGFGGAIRNPKITWHSEPPLQRRLTEAKRRIEREFPQVKLDPMTALDASGHAWVATGAHLLRYDGRNWTEIETIEDARRVSFVAANRAGRVFVGTSGEGLFIFDGDQVTRYNNDPDHARCVIYCMAEADDGTVYVGTQDGLYGLSGESWQRLTDWYQVHPIAIDRGGRVWFGDLNRGLVCYFAGETIESGRNSPAFGYRVEDLWLTDEGLVQMLGSRTNDGRAERKMFECTAEGVRLLGEPDETILRLRKRRQR